MNSFDPELVGALAEGTLEATEAAALEARIAADPAAAADLAAQRAALATLRSAPAPVLHESERLILRAAVADRLGLTPDAAPVATIARRRRPAWGAIAVAASTMVALVAFSPMLGQLLDRGADDGGPLSAEAVTTVADIARNGGLLAVPGAESESTDGMVTSTSDEFADTTTPAAPTEMTGRSLEHFQVADDLALLKADPEALAVLQQPADSTTVCFAEAVALLGTTDLTTFPYLTYVVFRLPAPDGIGPGTLVAFDPVDCSTPIAVP